MAKKILSFSFVVALVASALPHVYAGGDHGDEHPCGCEAEELDFKIDCSNRQAMLNAWDKLELNNCATNCESDVCHVNFLIVQSHHDYCFHNEVPEKVEDGFHDYEGGCEHCSILRKYDPNLPNCPSAICDERGDTAHQALRDDDCESDCSTDSCTSNFRILRAEHDLCEEDTLTRDAEDTLHDLEEVCEQFNCNILVNAQRSAAQLKCDEVSAKETTSVAPTTSAWMGAGAALGAALLVAH